MAAPAKGAAPDLSDLVGALPFPSNTLNCTRDLMDIERAKPAAPLFLLLALASALGVAVAVALAAIAMLLAAPAYADEGRLVLERPAGLAEAERLFSESQLLEEGRVLVVEAYYNPYA